MLPLRAYAVLLVLALGPTSVAAEAPNGQLPSADLTGATVLSRDDELVGVVGSTVTGGNGEQGLIIGLAGYLGAGEKDVAIPARGVERFMAGDEKPRHFRSGHYGGSGLVRIKVPMTVRQLLNAPAFIDDSRRSSPHVGAPTEPKGKAPSSTQSGGPG